MKSPEISNPMTKPELHSEAVEQFARSLSPDEAALVLKLEEDVADIVQVC